MFLVVGRLIFSVKIKIGGLGYVSLEDDFFYSVNKLLFVHEGNSRLRSHRTLFILLVRGRVFSCVLRKAGVEIFL